MPYRRISITFVVLALVAALLTSLLPPTSAEQKDRATGKPITSGEEASRGKERSHGKQRSPRDSHPHTTPSARLTETLSSDTLTALRRQGAPHPEESGQPQSDSKTRETSTDEEVISSQEEATGKRRRRRERSRDSRGGAGSQSAGGSTGP